MQKGQKHTKATKLKISQSRAAFKPLSQMSYSDMVDAMTTETASILTDYIRQYVGVAEQVASPASGVFMNFDRILNRQSYEDLAWFDLYDVVERDPHVLAVSSTFKMAVASLEWDVTPYEDNGDVSSKDQKIADFVKDNLLSFENFTQDMYELLDGIGKGFAVSEIIWSVGKETRIERLMNRPQRRFQFDAATRALKLRKMSNPYLGDPLPDKKFIVFRSGTKYENPFGDPLDQATYWMWLFKRMVMKFWATHLEVATGPIVYVKYPSGPSPILKSEALAIAQNIRNGAAGSIPNNMEVLFAEAKNAQAANVSYEKFVDQCNNEITKAWLGQTLTTEASGKSGSGSKALGQVHNDILAMRTTFAAHALEGVFNRMIKWLVDFNVNGATGYPKFAFVTEAPIDRLNEATIIATLKTAGYTTDPQYIEDEIGIPLEEEEAAPVVVQPQIPEGVQQ